MNIAYCETNDPTASKAIKKYTGSGNSAKLYKNLNDVAQAIVKDECKKALVLIDHSWQGTSYEAYDLLHKHKSLSITQEVIFQENGDQVGARYVILENVQTKPNNANKSSLIFVVSHKPGSLYRALAVFENYELNLTKIESRKVYGKSYEYIFYVDFEYGKQHISRMDEILAVYRENTQSLRIAGFYNAAA